jgi:hypothetical protein
VTAMAAPFLTVIRGDATAEEVVALTAVLAAVAARRHGADAGGQVQRSGWSDRTAMLRRPVSHGPGAWQASSRPHFG